MSDVSTALELLAKAENIQDVADVVEEFSASVVNPAKGAVLFTGNVGAASANDIAVDVARNTDLNIISDTPRAQLIINNIDAIKATLTRVIMASDKTADPQTIQRLVSEALYGGNSTSLWGRASTEFVNSIRGPVTIIAQKIDATRILASVEIPALLKGLANGAVPSVNNILASKLPATAVDLIGTIQSSFTAALAKGGVFVEAGGAIARLSSEVLASYKLPL